MNLTVKSIKFNKLVTEDKSVDRFFPFWSVTTSPCETALIEIGFDYIYIAQASASH